MATFNLRDVPDEIVSAIDSAAKRQKLSRQEYLLERLVSEYGTARNSTLAITSRLREVLSRLAECRTYHLRPTPTTARVAECLGLESTAPLDDLMRGDRALSFADADRICNLFGVNRNWLLEGSGHAFGMSPLFREPWQVLNAIALDELRWEESQPYKELVFILPPNDGHPTCVFGRRDETGYRMDLLLNNVPLYGDNGGTGQSMLFYFCVLAAAVSAEASSHLFMDLRYGGANTSSYISATAQQHSELMWGGLHASCARSNLKAINWMEDIWDLEYVKSHQYYPKSLGEAYNDFKIIAEHKHGIHNNEQLFKFVKEKIQDVRKRAQEEVEFKRRVAARESDPSAQNK